MRGYGEWRFVGLLTVLVVTVLAAMMFVEQRYRQQQQQSQQEAVFERLGIIRYRLERELTNNLSLLTGTAAFIAANPDFTEEEYARYAAAVLRRQPAVVNLAAAPDLVVQHVYPVSGNEAALGLDYRQSDAQWPEVRQVVERREMLIAGPIELVQGGTAFVGRAPVLIEQEDGEDGLWGIVAAPVRVEAIFAAAGLPASADGLELGIRRADVGDARYEVFYGPASLFDADTTVFMPVTMGDMTWQLAGRSAAPAPTMAGVITIRAAGALMAMLVLIIATLRHRHRLEGRRLQQLIEHQASHDLLTGLPNRNLFDDRLRLALLRARRAGSRLAILFIDLDDFKRVNDRLGHRAGDEVLREVAGRLGDCVRGADTVARYSGDEFVVLLEEVGSASDAGRVCEKIVTRFNQPFNAGNADVYCGVSIGASFFPDDGEDGELLVTKADQAMYKVKESGKNSYQFFTASMQSESEDRHRMYNDLIRALDGGTLQVWFQPMLDGASGLFTGCEALVRWQAEDGSWVEPDIFVALAEERGLVSRLDRFVLEYALQAMARIAPQLAHPMYLSVNISAGVLRMQDDVAQAWLQQALSADCQLMVEITEQVLHGDVTSVRPTLEGLTAQGVEVAIDDFGTGYSGVGYFSSFPIRVLKMDHSFIAGIGKSKADERLIESILLLAERLGVRVIAEGVETKEQVDFLQAAGCHFMQGYYLARPMPEIELVDFLLSHSTGQE
ncbi:MAG: putative bifunctional diguanylate cyclase/phosphodiesterase [Pseudomonadota bacterium]